MNSALTWRISNAFLIASINPVQSCCIFIFNILENNYYDELDIPPHQNFNTVESVKTKSKEKPKLLKESMIQKILTKYYVSHKDRKGEVSFSSLILFCKVVDYEFRNINYMHYINMDQLKTKEKRFTTPDHQHCHSPSQPLCRRDSISIQNFQQIQRQFYLFQVTAFYYH